MTVGAPDPEPCRCNCGYTCAPTCALPIMQCIREHYVKDCDHVFDGPWVEGEQWQSVTCSKCKMPEINHALRVGP